MFTPLNRHVIILVYNITNINVINNYKIVQGDRESSTVSFDSNWRYCMTRAKNKYFKTIIYVFAITILLNVIAWNSVSFCDFYVENIFPLWAPLFGLFTEATGSSVGEIMLAIAIILVVLTVLFSSVLQILIYRVLAS